MTWRIARLLSCSCGHSLTDVVPISLSADAIALVKSQPPSWWQALALDRRWKLAHFLGALHTYGLRGKPFKKASIASVAMERNLLNVGAAIVLGGEAAFHDLLARIRIHPVPDVSVQLMKEAFPGLLVQMRCQLSMIEYESLGSYIRSFLLVRGDSEVVIAWRGKNNSATASAAECARTLGIRVERVTDLLSLHGFAPKIRQTATGRTMLAVGPDAMRQIRTSKSVVLARRSVSKIFGLSSARQDILIKAGLIRTVAQKVDGSSIIDLFQRISSRSMKEIESKLVDQVPFDQLLRTLIPLPLTASFFRSMLNGKIAFRTLTSKFEHVRDIEVSRLDVQTTLGTAKTATKSYLTIPEASVRLKLKQEVIYHLVNRGLIKVVHRRVGRRPERFIKEQELDRFSEEIESLVCAAARAGVSRQAGLKWAKGVGVQIVSGPSLDGGRQYFVRKSMGAM